MGLNLRAALTTLSRALPVVFIRGAVFVAGGFAVILFFGLLLFVLRPAGGVAPALALLLVVPIVLGGTAGAWLLRRFFLYRCRAAMLFLFSGRQPAAPGLAGVLQEAGRLFPVHARWVSLNRALRRALAGTDPECPPALCGQAVLTLAFSRSGDAAGRASAESLVLFLEHGGEGKRTARHWRRFSLAGLAILFLFLALPNWFFFSGAGAPVWIGIVLAAIIAWMLHQAFVIPLVLAGVSAALLAETQGRKPDPVLLDKIGPLLTP